MTGPFDPREGVTVEAPSLDFTVPQFLAWARTKPAGEEYDYTDPLNCAVCRFLRDTGRATDPRSASNNWSDGGGPRRTFDQRIHDAAYHRERGADETFGGLVKRLEALSQ